MLEQLKTDVCAAILALDAEGLLSDSRGSVSAIDRASDCLVVKPAGVPCRTIKPSQLAVVALETGQVLEGRPKSSPAPDLDAHRVLFRAFTAIGGIARIQGVFATAWAQARREIPSLGTTHAEDFNAPIPCTRLLTAREVQHDHDTHTGMVIVERFAAMDPLACPAVLVAGDGPVAWGPSVTDAAKHAIALEHLARLARETLAINPAIKPAPPALLAKHFARRHPSAARGQNVPSPRPPVAFPRHD